ncbi:dethiobiotin synthase [Sporosarcina sp. HYO08]|uniref:dethiobiotin synthase n=1 Tax=Sporosarcina sp. HYO08 TaxID=1759557 RepID=UPI000795B632|nr:dethiobiotin synthase [Sporosarcina sp. HYO08]KXH81760.1 ATP-dependent dethiobiotin synthetase BioD [Sporosarcina sp. HYO08]
MTQHFWVVGTDTDVGKTIITTYFMRYLQAQGKNVLPYKPVQTGIIRDTSRSYYGDTNFYQSFTEKEFVTEHLNSYSFPEPASPHYAARLVGTTIQQNVILEKIQQLTSLYDHVICEGAGGLFVPLDSERNVQLIDLIQESQLPVVLVARTTVGTINHTLLSIEALTSRKIPIAGLVLNAFEGSETEKDNIQTIQELTKLPILVFPRLTTVAELKEVRVENKEFFERLLPT